MTNYWSDELGRMVECEILWNGVGPGPGELRSREGWHQRYVPDVGKRADGSLPSQVEARVGATEAKKRCACGRVRSKKRKSCNKCAWASRKLRRPVAA